ncbi:ras and Rab interactor 3 [Hippocampus comes]|uniref:ras and Rab interactor 3 n=1 Tax=Hippocampus comes TaxID=109280 RepID=UPI00094E6C14|nr:PREDICTED: ras and Rab interactor 3-like [Hippocampus comes]
MESHSPFNGSTSIPWRRSRRKMTMLELLRGCQKAWCPAAPWDRAQARSALSGTPAGSFVVVRDCVTSLPSFLCVSSGGDDEALLEYNISCTAKVFQLSESRLSFSDLAQMVFFYSLTRDVLALCLRIPHWMDNLAQSNEDRLSQLEPQTWLSTPPHQMSDEMTHMKPNNIMCSIQLTSTNGAVCVINPLYLHEHGDDWLSHQATGLQYATPTSNYRRERRLSSARTWAGASLMSKRAISFDQEPSFANTECSAVGQALGSLVCQKKWLTHRVLELSKKKRGLFADAVREFVEVTLQRATDPGALTGSEFLQEVRSSLTLLRETLLDYPDIQALLDSMTDLSDSEIDSLVEMSVHKVALKPVLAHIYSCIHICRTNDGSLQRLESKQRVLEDNGVEALGGAAGVGVPDSVTLERIQQRWLRMHEAYSPNKKVHILLKICKSIYHSMSASASSDVVFGADDFLPCLTWVLLRSELVNLQIDTDYMMELLDPTQLQGEGGYYLTTLYAALYYISSFQPRLAARQLSVEAQHSLSQWHRRRTLHSNQSRHSTHRRTIRRQMCPEESVQASVTESSDVEESGEDEPQRETESDAETEGERTERQHGQDADEDTE